MTPLSETTIGLVIFIRYGTIKLRLAYGETGRKTVVLLKRVVGLCLKLIILKKIMKEFLPFNQSHEKPGERKEKKSIFKRMRDLKNAVVLTAILSFVAPVASVAAEKTDLPKEGTKITDVEKSKENARENVLKIVDKIRVKGQEGKIESIPVRKWVSPEGETLVVAFSPDGKPLWLIDEGKGSEVLFLDKDVDGDIDRILFNRQKAEGPVKAKAKSAFNYLKILSSIEGLASDARTTADLMPENVKVFEFGEENGELLVTAVDFQTGESEQLIGEEAEKLTSKVQGLFGDKVAQHSQEIAR